MNQTPIWARALLVSFFLMIHTTSLDEEAKSSLFSFLSQLSNINGIPDPSFGWNLSTDPCKGNWSGIYCDKKTNSSVTKLHLNSSSLTGLFNTRSLCNVPSLAASVSFIKLDDNQIVGGISAEIANCKQLTHLLLRGNQFSGNLPYSLAMLNNLKQLDISNNKFSSNLPDLSRISGLTMFLAQNNQLTGEIPKFDFSNLNQFNVSNNDFTGSIPNVNGKFPVSCFLGNPNLCGDPLPNKCPPSLSDSTKKESRGISKNVLMYSGYFALGLAFVVLILCRLSKRKRKEVKVEAANKVALVDVDDSKKDKASTESSNYKAGVSRSELSVNSTESALVSSSLLVLTSPVMNGLRFEDLLRAPAELLGRGKHGTLYKVVFENRIMLAVKRIKDWEISSDDFKQRMQRINRAKHPNVLPVLAFYCSNYDKLLVYEYQQNGSLFKPLHGNQMVQTFDWPSRLNIAARISEALTFMHQELHSHGIAHGNLKSSNILLSKNMEPCISEYGLMLVDDRPSLFAKVDGFKGMEQTKATTSDAFKADIYGFGVILLELLTGKLVQNEGLDLAAWVHAVVREEWTVEVFDKSLILEGASEERMVSLLQVAIKCVNHSPEARPSINQVATMVNTIKEEEERSVTYDT